MKELLDKIYSDIIDTKRSGLEVTKIFINKDVYLALIKYCIANDVTVMSIPISYGVRLFGFDVSVTHNELENGYLLGVNK
jgi:hypothetical protein